MFLTHRALRRNMVTQVLQMDHASAHLIIGGHRNVLTVVAQCTHQRRPALAKAAQQVHKFAQTPYRVRKVPSAQTAANRNHTFCGTNPANYCQKLVALIRMNFSRPRIGINLYRFSTYLYRFPGMLVRVTLTKDTGYLGSTRHG